MRGHRARRFARAWGLAAAAWLAAGFSSPVSAAVKTWVSSVSDAASNPAKWTPPGVPVPGDSLVFDGSLGFGSCSWDLSIGLSSITVTNGYNATINFNVPVSFNGLFEFTSPYISTVNFNSSVTLNGPLRVLSPARLYFTDSAFNLHSLNGPVVVGDSGALFHIGGATVVAVGSVTVNAGILEMHDKALFQGTTIYVASGGQLHLFDDSGGFTGAPVLTSTSPSARLSLTVDGLVNVSSAVLGRLSPEGLRIGASAGVLSLSSVTFGGPLLPGTTAINFYFGGNFVSTFTNVNFADSGIAVNVNGSLLGATARITMLNASGLRAGPAYENDPNSYVDWPGFAGGGGPLVHASGPGESAIAQSDDNEFSISAAFGGGNFFVPWQIQRGSSSIGLGGQFVSPSGALVGASFDIVPRTANGGPGAPVVASDGTNFLAAFVGGAGVDDVKAQLVGPSGSLISSPLLIAGGGTAGNQHVGSAAFDGANYFVVWEASSTATNGVDIFGQLVSPSGTLVGSAVTISNALSSQSDPYAAFGGGKYLVAWHDDSRLLNGTDADIKGQFVLPSGALSGSNFFIDQNNTDSKNPVIVSFNGANFLVTHHENVSFIPPEEIDLYGALVSPAGAFVSSFTIAASAANIKFLPTAAWEGSQFRITWADAMGHAGNSLITQATTTIHQRLFDALGVPLGPEVQVSSSIAGKIPGVAFLTRGSTTTLAIINRQDLGTELGGASNSDVYGLLLSSSAGGGSSGGQGIGFDPSGNLWEVVEQNGVFELDKYLQAGVFQSSVALPNAYNFANTRLAFDGAGNAYVVGTASGPLTVGGDLVVYAAPPAGGVLTASATYNNSQFNLSDFGLGVATDSAGNLWITGGIQTSGPVDLNGPVSIALGLWKFTPSSGLLAATTVYYGAAGTEIGFDIGVDASDNLWVIAYSSNPATAGPNRLDLALYKYNPAGTAMLSATRLAGYAHDLDRVQANLALSAGGIYAAASLLTSGGNYNLGFVKYDLAGGTQAVRAWHNTAAGGNDHPGRIVVDRNGGVLIAGQFAEGTTSSGLAVWQYDFAGGFVSAQTVSGMSNAHDVAVNGANAAWLAVSNSTAPFNFTAAAPASIPGVDVNLAGGGGGTGATKIWAGPVFGSASAPANWIGGAAPVNGDYVVFGATNPFNPCAWDLAVTLSSITFTSGYFGEVDFNSPIAVGGPFEVLGPAQLYFTDNAANVHSLNGPVTLNNPSALFHIGGTTVAASGAVAVSAGALEMHDKALFLGSNVYVASSGRLHLYDSSGGVTGPPLLTSTSSASRLSLTVDGTVDITSGVFGRLDPGGLRIGGSQFQLVNLSSVAFQGPLLPGTTAINFYTGGTYVSTFTNVNFADANIAVNVNAQFLSIPSRITMRAASGPTAGPLYENDLGNFVDWPDFTAGGGGGLAAGAFTDLTDRGFTASWVTQFLPGMIYYCEVSTAPLPNNFSGNASSITTNVLATFSTLSPGTLYYARVSTNPTTGPFTSLGSTTTLFGAVAAGPAGFFRLAFDNYGNLWAANERLSEVRRYPAPVPTAVFDEQTPAAQALTPANGINAPLGLAFDSFGNLWVAVSTGPSGSPANRLKRYNSFGGGSVDVSSSQVLSSLLADVASVAFQPGSGDMWVANHAPLKSGQASVVRFLNSGPPATAPIFSDTNVSTFAFAGAIYKPSALLFDKSGSGNLWVASDSSGTIKMYPNSNGIIAATPALTLTGTPHPLALAFDFNGNLFVGDGDVEGAPGNGSLWRYDNLGTPAQPSLSPAPVLLQNGIDVGGLAFDFPGNLWGSDYNASTIVRLSTSAPTVPSEFGVIKGTISYIGLQTGNYLIAFSTSVKIKTSDAATRLVPAGSIPGPFTVSGLLAPNTYYVTAILDTNANNQSDGFEPRGRYITSPAPAPSAEVYVAANSTATGITVQLLDVIAVTGTVTNNSLQSGSILVQAWLGTPNDASPGNLLDETPLPPQTGGYALYVSTISNLYVRAYVDSNFNGLFDQGEDAGTSGTLSGLLAGTTVAANVTIGASAGGTVYVQAADLAPATLPTSKNDAGLLRLGLWTSGGNAQLSSLLVDLAGNVPAGNVNAKLYKDANGNGLFEPGLDYIVGNQFFAAGFPPQARVSLFSAQTLSAATQYFFLGADLYNAPAGRQIGLSIGSPQYFGLATGSMAGQPADYPLKSGLALIQLTLFANPNSGGYPFPFISPPGGGLGTGLFLQAGQSVSVAADGSWGSGRFGPTGPDGVSGQFGGLGANLVFGSLVGRVGGSPWFQLGSNVTFASPQSGELAVAMNDDNYGDNSGAVTVNASIAHSTITRVWVGGDSFFPNSAGRDSNWQGGQRPFPGDRVEFSSSSVDCFWDIQNIELALLTATTSYTGVLRLSGSGALAVSSDVVIAGGVLDLGYNNFLSVQGTLLVTSGATLDMGQGYSHLQTEGLTLKGGAFLRSLGNGFAFMENIVNGPAWPFRVEDATVTVASPGQTTAAPTGGLTVRNSSVIDISSSAAINALDNVFIQGEIQNGSPSVKLHSLVPVTRSFNGWSFDQIAVSTNVDASDVAAGSQITFVHAAGGRFGSPYELDPNNVVAWSPDGGGLGSISGVVSYSPDNASGDYHLLYTTDPEGDPAKFGLGVFGGTVLISSGTPGFTLSDLQAPNTWYLFAYKSFNYQPSGFDPRGGFGNPGSYRSAPLFLGAGAALTGKNITLKDWGSVSGNLTMNSSQVGPVLVQAWRGEPALSTSTLESDGFAPAAGGFYSLNAPPATDYFILGFVDVNGNGRQDSFEAFGSSSIVTVAGLLDHPQTDITVAGGSAAAGGTVYLTTAAAHNGGIGTLGPQALLRLKLFSAGLDAMIKAVHLEYTQPVPPQGVGLSVYEDSNNNGVFDSGTDFAPGQTPVMDSFKNSIYLQGGASTGTVEFFQADTIVAGGTRTYFVVVSLTVDQFGEKAPFTGVQISSSANFGLTAGSMADQPGLYPVAATAAVLFNVPAYFEAFPDNRGGAFTGLHVFRGQKLSVTAGGTWFTSGNASAVGPGGSGPTGLNTVLPAARLGELIGRIDNFGMSTPWFRVGTSTSNVLVAQDGQLVLAMNDYVGGYYDGNSGSVLADFSVSGSTLGAVAGAISYKGQSTGPLDVTATSALIPPGTVEFIPFSRTSTLTLVSGTTAYPYAVTDLPPGPYRVTATVRANPLQTGDTIKSVDVVAGSTTTVDLSVSLGTSSISGSLFYSGSQNFGNFLVAALTTNDFEGQPQPVAVVSLAGGSYTLSLPVPNTYYLAAFRDSNSNTHPDGNEPFGFFGSTNAAFSDAARLAAPVFLSETGGPAAGKDITLTDRGGINGTINVLSGATGRIVVEAGRGAPGTPGFAVESRDFEPVSSALALTGIFYHADLLRPATDYTLFAFLDSNLNGQLDVTEPFFQSGTLAVAAGSNLYLSFPLLQAPPPPSVSSFKGTGAHFAVSFEWNGVVGASQYELRNSTSGLVATVLQPATQYADVLPANTSSQITMITASNVNGTSPPLALGGTAALPAAGAAAVFSLAEAPSALAVGAATGSSASLSWTRQNPAGTFFEIHRATGGAAPGIFSAVLTTSATSVADQGLAPNATFFWKILAVNGNALKSGFSNQASTRTPAATVPSIAGTLSYAGQQTGSIVLEAGLDPLFFTPPAASASLPNISAQGYYLQLAGNTSYYVRAFVDFNGDRFFEPGEDAGAFVLLSTPTQVFVANAPVTGKNFSVAVDTVPPSSPLGVSASPGLGQVFLNWAAPGTSADGTVLNDLLGYRVERSTGGGVFLALNDVPLPRETLSFIDFSPVAEVKNSYRVRAVDYGLNLSPAVAPVSVLPSAGGTISGTLSTFTATTSGLFRVRLATVSASNSGFLSEIALGEEGSYSFTGLSTGTYFLRGFQDLNNDNAQGSYEPSGTFGAVRTPFPIPIFGGNSVAGADVTVCDRVKLSAGSPAAGALAVSGCPAKDKGPGFTTSLYAFTVGDGSAGSLGVGAQVDIQMTSGFEGELVVLAPDGGVIARDNNPGGPFVHFIADRPGVYVVEPTSYFAGATGAFTLSMNVVGGFSGQISGSVAYPANTYPGTVIVQLFDRPDSGAFPVNVLNFPSPSPYSFTGLRDGTYYVRAFLDLGVNHNFVKDLGEPSGVFGLSASSPTAVSIVGGVSSLGTAGADITLTDPAGGRVAGSVLYNGAQAGPIRVELGTKKCADCDDLDVTAFLQTASTQAATAFAFDFIPPATNYVLRTYVDVNSNLRPDVLEAKASSSPVTVSAFSTTTVHLLLQDPGSGASGNATIRGGVFYDGSASGNIFVGFTRDSTFNFIDYIVTLSTQGSYLKAGIVGGTTYYMAGFRDTNGNGNPDEALGEPIGVGAPESFSGTPGFDNPPPILVPLSGSATANLTLNDPPNGSVSGQVSYSGTSAPAGANIVVQAYIPNSRTSNTFQRAVIVRVPAVTAYAYNLPFLAAATNYQLNAFVDVNGNSNSDFGEPFGQLTKAVAVSSGTGAVPRTGVNFQILEAGSLGSGLAGEIDGRLVYAGAQGGDFVVRFFTNPTFSGLPSFTQIVTAPAGPGTFSFVKTGLQLNTTFYIDAFRDTTFTRTFNPLYQASGKLLDGAGVALDADGPVRDVGDIQIKEPSAGAAVGARSISGSVLYRGTLVNSGTVRTVLFPLALNQAPVAFSSAPFAATTGFRFDNVAAGTYQIQSFVDVNNNFIPDPTEPIIFSTSTGIELFDASVADENLVLCDRAPIVPGAQLSGTLTAADCVNPDRGGARQKLYTFKGTRGQSVTIELDARDFYGTSLALYAADGSLLVSDDGYFNGGNARIDGFVLPLDGDYTLGAGAVQPEVTGSFDLGFRGSAGSLGSIAGDVVYNGTQGGAIVVGLFKSPDFTPATLLDKRTLAADRAFQFNSLPTGTSYYLAALVDVNFNGLPDPGEDSAAFGTGQAASPLLLSAGQNLTGVEIVINASTKAVTNVGYAAGSIGYAGFRTGVLRVEFWPTGDFSGQPVAVRSVDVLAAPGSYAYDLTVLGGVPYFPRAYLDANNNFIPDLDEPKGFYSPNNQGAEPLFVPAAGSLLNADFSIEDPGFAAGAGGISGEGTASIAPSTAPAGGVFTATLTYTAGPSGLQTGGSAGFSVPPGFSFPQFLAVTSTAAATFSPVQFSGIGAFVTVTGGSVLSGQQVRFLSENIFVPCFSASTQTFSVVSAQNSSAASQPLFAGSPSVVIAPGQAGFFQPFNPYFSVKQGVRSDPQVLEARDFCGNKVAISGSAKTVVIRAKSYDYLTGQFADDLTVGLSSRTSVSTASALSLDFTVGRSSRTFFVVSDSTGSKNLEIFYNLAGETTSYYGFTTLPGNALSRVSVSTLPFGTGQKLATISPNADPASPNQAFINFTLGDPNLSWRVLVSSVPYKEGVEPAPLWERWGYGQPSPGEVAWDGRSNPWVNGGARVANGFYYLRVEVAAGLKDDTLVVKVNAPQLAGKVLDAGVLPNAPLAGARVDAFGPFGGGGSAVSDELGKYVLPGIAGGTYQLFLHRDDYLDGSVSVTLDAAGLVSTFTATTANVSASTNSAGGLDLLMRRSPVLIVVPSGAGITPQPFDRWGGLQVSASTAAAFGQTLFGPLRLKANSTVFDDGGQWDPGTQRFVERTLLKFQVAVGTYTVTANFADFAPSSATVFVGAAGETLPLPDFIRKSSVSGLVKVDANPVGMFISVNAVPLSTTTRLAGGFGGVFLNPGVLFDTYTVTNLDAGTYLLRANAPNLIAVTTGPIAVPVSSDVTHVDFSTFTNGVQITGVVTIQGDTTGESLQLNVNAWAPGSLNFGSTDVFKAGGVSGLTIPYTIKGLDQGATYQMYVNLFGHSGARLEVLENLPSTAAAPGTANFTFAASSGVIAGTIILPNGAMDFLNVDLFGQTVASARPGDVGHQFQQSGAHTLPGFACTANNQPAPTGYCPANNSSATFRVEGLQTETDDVTLLYKTSGQTKKLRISVVNGSTATVSVSLAAQTFSIAGSINNQITNARFNTNRKIFDNAPDLPVADVNGTPASLDPAGVPRSTASLARVVAIRQDINTFNVAISTVFDAANSRVGFLTAAGTYTITNVPPGVYYVRTANLRDCATCAVLVPQVGQIVSVAASSRSGVNFTLSDGFSVGGTIALDNGIQDWRIFNLTVTNRRQEVVRSTTVYLGNQTLGIRANSVDYSFANLPSGDFFTLTVKGTLFPIKYAGKPIKFPDPGLSPNGLQSNLANQNVLMQRAAYVVGKLKDANTGEVLGKNNVTLLAPNFQISATANPWIEGGFVVSPSSVSGRPLEFDDQGSLIFRAGPLIPDISYDVKLGQTRWDPLFLAQGSQNYAPVTLSGLTPQPGEIKDVGVVPLSQGQSLTGTVRQSTTTGALLGNIKVTAKPSFGFVDLKVETYTNSQGKYTIWVSSAVSNQYDVTAAPRDGNLASNGLVYGEVTLRNVNLIATTTADFLLNPLLQKVTGQVLVEDSAEGGQLSYPFGGKRGFPAAALNLQPDGVIPVSDPLGDIQETTDEHGRFEIVGLSTGTYNLKVTSLGYGVLKATVTTTATGYRVYTGSDTPANYLPGNVLTLRRGATVTGRIAKSDGSTPNDTEVGGIAAANFAQNEFVIGSVDVDPNAKTVNSYTISGFKTGVDYDIVILPKNKGDDTNFPPEGSGVRFEAGESTTTKNLNLTFLSSGFDCVPASKKALGNNQFQIRIECSKPLRKKVAADDDLSLILTVSSGTGVMLGAEKELSGNRRKITTIYRGVTGEANFSLRLRASSSEVDPKTGQNFALDKVFDFFAGLDSNATKKLTNIQGGSVELEPTAEDESKGLSERAKLDVPPGSFAEGDDDATSVAVASKTLDVSMNKGKDQKLAKTLALRTLGYVPESLNILDNPAAYPAEMAEAIKAYRVMAGTDTVNGANPLSSFYSIFLPLTVRHQLKQRADLTLSYLQLTAKSSNPENINVWFYCSIAGSSPRCDSAHVGKWLLENDNRRLDQVNQTITVGVDHLSTFVVLDSTPVLTSTVSFPTNDILAANFPNPADCIVHSNIDRNTTLFGSAGKHGAFQGTMIRYTLPSGGLGDFEPTKINIYNLAGELVRTIDQGSLQGGQTYYYPWDCGNSSGRTVSSGVYIGEVVWGGKKKFFKMAIIKGSGL